MYTATILNKSVQQNRQRILITVRVTDGEQTFDKDFSLSFSSKKEDIADVVRSYVKELEAGKKLAESITNDEVIDISEPEEEKTQEEQARDIWLEKWNEYSAAQKGIDALAKAGVEPTKEELDAFNQLKNWVAENRKAEYVHHIINI